MDKLTQREWNDVAPSIINRPCAFCGRQEFVSEPHYCIVGDTDVLSVTCSKCGHIELFDVDGLRRCADDIDEEYREKGLR